MDASLEPIGPGAGRVPAKAAERFRARASGDSRSDVATDGEIAAREERSVVRCMAEASIP